MNFPLEFEHRMQQQLGESWFHFLSAMNEPSPTSIRRNSRKQVHPVALERVPWSTDGYYLETRPVFTLDPALHAGAYYVQEASSMFLESALRQSVDLREPLRVLDLCAAPGGKSTLIAALLNDQSLLVSNEAIRSRVGVLTENIHKWGNDNVVVTNNDPADFQTLPGFFDVIVVDAPCSGEGLFRKDPEAMTEWSAENVMICSKRQRRILTDAWPSLKENGLLIYSTCTYNAMENEENLQWLGAQHDVEFPDLQPDPSWGIECVHESKIKGYRFYPHRLKGEGFFLSVARKKTHQDEIQPGGRGLFSPPPRKIADILRSWVMSPEEKTFIQRNELLQFLPSAMLAEIELLVKHLNVVSAGTFMATAKHDKLIPEHPMALSLQLARDNFETLEVHQEDALRYLRRESLPLATGKKGFALITHQQLPLG
ncbi:MAG TPA: RsmB/NOP family class I SAM-dependent RNA methyltransferase, partial [Ohtaekwangia sp.]|nr:RsmB/NOP family class I SAM-dependent RNA methyltransferase [Ohtaekwangia sp.]